MDTVTSIEFLDVSLLPRSKKIPLGFNGGVVDLNDLLLEIKPIIEAMQEAGIFKKTESFGFASVKKNINLDEVDPDDPYSYIDYVGGWGPDMDRYIANAVRKIRAMLREQAKSTLDIKYALAGNKQFRDVVVSMDEDNRFPWGDFPHGGAVTVEFWLSTLRGAVSALTEEQDAMAASMILNHFGMTMFLAGKKMV